MATRSIREIIDNIYNGQIRIPAFQRGYIWEPDRVAYLMDSIYKKYPFGSLLFWRTKEKLKSERDFGPFKIPELKEDYPVDYVLDGQQRVTSIFGVFQTQLSPREGSDWVDIYFDYTIQSNPQERQFFALKASEVDGARHFPLNTLFDTTAYRQATENLPESAVKRIDEMQSIFKEVQIPIQEFKTEDKTTVAIIFERVNRQGVPLDTLQLLTAWTWSEDFHLNKKFEALSEELDQFGFGEAGTDTNLMLRCCSAILAGDGSTDSLIKLNGEVVRTRFEEISSGIKGAIDFLKNNLHVSKLANLPYDTLLVPLSVFFSTNTARSEVMMNDNQRKSIEQWIWRSCFSRRYSSGVLRNLKTDIDEIKKLRNKKSNRLLGIPIDVDESFFLYNQFYMGTVATKAFILLLAQKNPLSFVSGSPINLDDTLRLYNRTEYHHLMPKAYLEGLPIEQYSELKYDVSALANFCFLSRVDNRVLGGLKPSRYKSKMPDVIDSILESALCPADLFKDDYNKFAYKRAQMLVAYANNLCGVS